MLVFFFYQHELSSDHLGRVEIDVRDLLCAERMSVGGWRPIRKNGRRAGGQKGELLMRVEYR